MGLPIKTTNLPNYVNRLGDIPGWVVIPTIQKQSVAEHTLNVIAITRELCEMRHVGITPQSDYFYLDWALRHDTDEVKTGDIPTTAKDGNEVHGNPKTESVRLLVKLADTIERVVFMYNEELLGNRATELILEDSKCRMIAAFNKFKEHSSPNRITLEHIQAIIDSMMLTNHPSMETKNDS